VAGGAAIPFDSSPGDLLAKMQTALAMPEEQRTRWRELAAARVRERYSWDAVTEAYEKLLLALRPSK